VTRCKPKAPEIEPWDGTAVSRQLSDRESERKESQPRRGLSVLTAREKANYDRNAERGRKKREKRLGQTES